MDTRFVRTRGLVVVAVVLTLLVAATGLAYAFSSGDNPGVTGPNTITWTGRGAADGVLNTEECLASQTPSGVADEEYLHWVLTTDGGSATGASLTLAGSGSGTYAGDANPNNSRWDFDTPYVTPDAALEASAAFTVVTTGNGPWVLTISHGCSGATDDPPLTVSKTVSGVVAMTYDWSVSKSADPTAVHAVGGSSVPVDYEIVTTHDGGTPVYTVTGEITVTNPNADSATGVDVMDTLDNGGDCTITGGGESLTVAPGTTVLDYSCTYDAPPTSTTGVTNTVRIEWPTQPVDGSTLAGGSAEFVTDPFDFTSDTVDECVTVTDAFDGAAPDATDPDTVCVGDANPTTIAFSRPVTVTNNACDDFGDTATITASDTGATDQDDASVRTCGGITDGLTIGFWQNPNGQTLIKNAPVSGTVCSLVGVLRAYAPFQDLNATSSCAQVATYVTNVIKAANAKGASMNVMLKAQMMATALDVWQTPALGSRFVDLTLACKAVGNCAGPDANPGQYVDASAAFGSPPASACLSVSTMLAYAGAQANTGGIIWYGNTKSTQELAKNAFDTINNNKAWAC